MFRTIALACAAAVLAGSALARPASCLLVVDGTVYIDGPCDFEPIDGNGSFIIHGPKNIYFAQVNLIGKGVAEATWNEDPVYRHAHGFLGTLTRNDACWANVRAQICAW